jgi:two-component system, cell cycle sensor histidine kinase and response regulator CckA
MYNRRVRVLLIDDDEDDYIITRDLLDDLQIAANSGRFHDEMGFELDWVDNYEDGLNAIKLGQHEVYLVDYRLGEVNGLTLLREGVQLTNAPFILLTGQGDREIDVEAMRAGAADYLVKGSMDAALLERSIRYAVERKNAERIRQNLEEQLREAQKMEAIGRLAGGIAHDFNNSLTIILTCSQLMQRADKTPAQLQEYAYDIERAGQQAHALTRQLLAISLKQKLEPRLVDLNKLIAGLKNILQRALGPNIEMLFVMRQMTSLVRADPSQLEQVIMNLVLNARDALPDGGKIVIETDRKYLDKAYTDQHIGLEPGLYTSLTVSDTGKGISHQALPHIFEPFYSTKDNHGTGLGLATVYGIVQQSGGQIRVYSELDFGTVFKIYLPPPDGKPLVEEEVAAETTVSPALGTILVVDDDPNVRQLLVELLSDYGYLVLNAADPTDALRLVQNYHQPIDLLITDMVIPNSNGRKLARLIRKQRPQIKVIFMSGYTRSVLDHHGLLDNNVAFLDKPLEINSVLSLVQESLI